MKQSPMPIARLLMAAVIPAVLAAGCESLRSDTATEVSAMVPDCSRADRQIAELEALRADRGERIAATAQTFVPQAAAVNILRGTFPDRVTVMTGEHNAVIDAKIAEIRRTCGLP
jgi:anti-sigma factor RsiW